MTSDAGAASWRDTLDRMVRHYGYCSECSEESLRMVLGNARFYVKRAGLMFGAKYEMT